MPSNASDFSNFDYTAATLRIKNENMLEKEELKKLKKRAKETGLELAEKLAIVDPDIRRIWGFGSVFEKDRPFTLNSDIDLAIEGGNIVSLFGITENAPFPVDLIDITDQRDPFATLIRENGTVLFERKGAGRETF